LAPNSLINHAGPPGWDVCADDRSAVAAVTAARSTTGQVGSVQEKPLPLRPVRR